MWGCNRWRSAGGVIFLSAILGGTVVCADEPDLGTLQTAATEIQLKNQKVTASLLAADRKVINSAYPTIKAKLSKRGFGEADINLAMAAGWKNLRDPSSRLVGFSERTFAAYVARLGKLKIESTPDEAYIDIDGNRQNEITNTAKWLAPRRYKFTLSRDDYFPQHEDRVIVEGDNPPLNMTLTPKIPPKP